VFSLWSIDGFVNSVNSSRHIVMNLNSRYTIHNSRLQPLTMGRNAEYVGINSDYLEQCLSNVSKLEWILKFHTFSLKYLHM